MSGPHWVSLAHGVCVFPEHSGSRVLAGHCPKQALPCMPLPGPCRSGDQALGKRTVPGRLHILITSPVPGSVSQAHRESALSVACLLWGADLWLQPSRRTSAVQDPRKTWLATGSLLTVWWSMASLGLRLPLAFRLWLFPACLSASDAGGGVTGSTAGQLSFGVHSDLFGE